MWTVITWLAMQKRSKAPLTTRCVCKELRRTIFRFRWRTISILSWLKSISYSQALESFYYIRIVHSSHVSLDRGYHVHYNRMIWRIISRSPAATWIFEIMIDLLLSKPKKIKLRGKKIEQKVKIKKNLKALPL